MAEQPVKVAQLRQRDQVGVEPVHLPLPAVLDRAAQKSLVVDSDRSQRQDCLDNGGHLRPRPRVGPLKNIDNLGDDEIGEDQTARRSIDERSSGASSHLGD